MWTQYQNVLKATKEDLEENLEHWVDILKGRKIWYK
jgi:hypothetical protein